MRPTVKTHSVFIGRRLCPRNIIHLFSSPVNIINESFDIRYGARQIKRYVSKHIEGLIANALINDEIIFGSHILIDYKEGNYLIR